MSEKTFLCAALFCTLLRLVCVVKQNIRVNASECVIITCVYFFCIKVRKTFTSGLNPMYLIILETVPF